MSKFKCPIWFLIIICNSIAILVELRSVQNPQLNSNLQVDQNVKCQSKTLPAPFVSSNGHCECIRGYNWNGTECVLDFDNTTPETIQTETKATIPEVTATKATIPEITATKAPIPEVTATKGTIPEISATKATIPEITVTKGTISEISATKGTITQVTNTQKPSCTCTKGFIKIAETCVPFDSNCSNEMLEKCKTKGATSCRLLKGDSLNQTKEEKPQCHCKEGDIPYTENPDNINDWKCIPHCDLLALPEQLEFRCIGSYEHCDSKGEFGKFAHKLKSADWSNSVFVKGETKLNSTDEKLFCKCDAGFERVLERCVPYEKPAHYISGMEFDWNPIGEEDEQEYLRRIETAFEQLIKSIMKLTKVHDTECFKKDQKSENTISCGLMFESDLLDSEIRDRLEKACVKISDEKCVYNIPSSVEHHNLCPTKHS